uniref:Uncharacterized protein n=1 Tax=Stomoxys calcitrans TaxID=35570 RepID=A0A905STE4_STOCA
MDPYPKLRIVNVTNENVTQYFPNVANIRDFKGYTLNIPVQADVPYTLLYKNPTTSEYEMDGIGGWIVKELMRRLNVTLNVYPLNWSNSNYLYITHIHKMLLSGEIELSPHMFTTVVSRDLDYSYPYVASSLCVMAPVPKRESINLLGFFDYTLCLFLLLMVVANEIIWKLYWHYLPRMHLSRPFLPYCSLYVILVFLGIPLPTWRIRPIRSLRLCGFLRILLFFFILTYCGMYISQIFSSNLSSYLTASYLRGPSFQLNNIFESEVPLMLSSYMANTLRELYNLTEADMYKYFVVASWDVIEYHRVALNASYMYLVPSPIFELIAEQQRYLDPKRFVTTQICYGTFPYQMQLRADSHFTDLLYEFILHLRESGLHIYLKTDLLQRARKFGNFNYIRDENSSESSYGMTFTFNTLTVMIFVLAVGYSCSLVAFVWEWYGQRICQIWSKKRCKLMLRK